MFYHGFPTGRYDGLKGPLFSSMVSSEVFSEFEIVLGSVKQFSEVSNSSRRYKQFSEVSNSSRKSQTVLGSFKQLSEVSNSSQKSQIVLIEVSNSSRGIIQFSAVSNCPRTLKQLLVFGDTFCDLVILLTVIKFAYEVGLVRNMEFLQCMDGPKEGCQQLNPLEWCFIIHNTIMIKQDSLVKLSNLAVPSPGKESKAAGRVSKIL